MVVFMKTRGMLAHHGYLFLLWSRLLRMLHQVSGRSSLCLPGGHHPVFLGSRLVLWLWTCGSCRHRGNSWATLLHQHQWPCLAERSVSICFLLQIYGRCNYLRMVFLIVLSFCGRKSSPLIKAIFRYKRPMRDEEVAELVNCLPPMCKTLSLSSALHKLGMLVFSALWR